MNEKRLLVVDDDPDIGALVKEVAEKKGFHVATVASGDDFRAVYPGFEPSVVVLDLMLPGEDGIKLLHFLGSQRSKADVALVSGVDSKVLNAAARLAALHGFRMLGTFQKPFSIPDLETALEKARPANPAINERDLDDAISGGAMCLHYQPKMDLRNGLPPTIDSVEALMRWQHPQHGLILPGRFIALAEETGLVDRLTDIALTTSLQQAREWREAGAAVPIAVNLPARLLADVGFADRVIDLLDGYGLPGSQLALEVTETGVMVDGNAAMETLTRLRLRGIALSIDDFGTGYSSLVQLYRMPFSELKIDKSFVIEMLDNEEARIIVRSVIDLAHNLGMIVCAEGVENAETAEALQALGCEKAQGYFFARPCSTEEVTELLLGSARKRATAG